MDFEQYIHDISFRFIQPHHWIPLPKSFPYRRLDKLIRTGTPGWPERFGAWFERVNTVLPENDAAMKERLGALCLAPRMSTIAAGAMINFGVSQMAQGEAFVNVGVWFGYTFLAGLTGNSGKKCIGVDNFSEFGGPRKAFLSRYSRLKGPEHLFYDMDYEKYFADTHRGPIGFYIYDGSHDYDNQLKGLQIAEPHFSENCIVLVDDTNWEEPRQATLDFVARSTLKYKVLSDIPTHCNCHPTLWNGVMIFRRSG